MQYTTNYQSPLGSITLAADETGLTGLWFEGQKYFALSLNKENKKALPISEQTSECQAARDILIAAGKWLDIYFSGNEPDFKLPLHFMGSAFQNEVWEILYQIPYGQTTTYGAIAKQLAKKKGLERMSAQAVGGAVAHNEISIIVPCHRVVGTNGSLTGYAGGIDKKIALLKMEKACKDTFFIPEKSTAP